MDDVQIRSCRACSAPQSNAGKGFRFYALRRRLRLLGSDDLGSHPTANDENESNQVAQLPDVDADQAVSRRQEVATIRYYHWPAYMDAEPAFPQAQAAADKIGDPHLRSAKEVANDRVDASDGPLGNIADFIIDDEGQGVLDLVASVESSTHDPRALVPTRWLSEVSWDDGSVQSRHPRVHSITADGLIEAWRA